MQDFFGASEIFVFPYAGNNRAVVRLESSVLRNGYLAFMSFYGRLFTTRPTRRFYDFSRLALGSQGGLVGFASGISGMGLARWELSVAWTVCQQA